MLNFIPPYAISYNCLVPEVQKIHKTLLQRRQMPLNADAQDCITAVCVSFGLLVSVFVKQSGRKDLKSFYKL